MKRRDRVGALERDLVLELAGNAPARSRRGSVVVERIAVGIGGGKVEDAGQQRLVVAAEISVAIDRGAAEMRAVVALLQRHEFGALRLAVDLVVLAGEAQAVSTESEPPEVKKERAQAILLEPFRQLIGQLDQRRVGGAAEGRIIGQLVELVADRLFHRLAGIAEIDVPQAADGIEHLLAVDVDDLHALGRH